MNTTEKNKSLLYATLAVALMIGGGVMLSWALNVLYFSATVTAMSVLSLALLSVFIYIAGATLIARSIRINNTYRSRSDVEGGAIFAFLLIAAGALMICFNTEVLNINWKSFFLSWQMLVFVVGAISICRSHFIWGTLFSAAGVFFLLEKAASIYPDITGFENFTATYWPAIFIVLGLVIVLSSIMSTKFLNRKYVKVTGNWKDDDSHFEAENNDGKINYRFVFGGTEQVILDPVFKGGKIDVTFGGMELNLRRTSLAEGKTFLYVNAVFGGVEINAPEHWDIELVSKSFAGGVTDDRLKVKDIDHTKRLVIVANCTFGGITVK